jgi:hypothetical protein
MSKVEILESRASLLMAGTEKLERLATGAIWSEGPI